MLLTNLDIIVRKWLLERSLPIHYYSEGLYHSAASLMLLTQDTLQIINTANLPVDDTGNIQLPDDFDEDLTLCIPSGQRLINLPKQDWVTPLRIHDTESGEFVPYTDNDNIQDNAFQYFGFRAGFNYYWNVDTYGSFRGRNFGGHGGTALGYQVFKQQRRIQLTEGLSDTSAVLMYVSDGQQADNASQIDTKATRCIITYIDWQSSPNRTNENSPEARTFFNQKRRLRTLLNQLTIADIRNILRNAYTAGLKF